MNVPAIVTMVTMGTTAWLHKQRRSHQLVVMGMFDCLYFMMHCVSVSITTRTTFIIEYYYLCMCVCVCVCVCGHAYLTEQQWGHMTSVMR